MGEWELNEGYFSQSHYWDLQMRWIVIASIDMHESALNWEKLRYTVFGLDGGERVDRRLHGLCMYFPRSSYPKC